MESGRNIRVFNKKKDLQSDLARWHGAACTARPKLKKQADTTPPLYVALTTPTKAWSDTPVASP